MNEPWRDRVYASYVSTSSAPGDLRRLVLGRKPFIEQIIRRHMRVPKETPILDLGCGHGAFIYFLRLHGFGNVTGVDVSQEQVATARELGITGVNQGDLMDHLRNVPAECIGVVLLMDILEHLTRPEAFAVLDEVFRVLQPGGKLILHVPNAEGIFGMRIRYGDVTHEQCFTCDSGAQLLKTVGFRSVSAFEDKPIPHGLKSVVRRVIWDIGTLVPRLLLAAETGCTGAVFSQNMLLVATKA